MKKYIKGSRVSNIFEDYTKNDGLADIVSETDKILGRYKKFEYISWDFDDNSEMLRLYIELNPDMYKDIPEDYQYVELAYHYYDFEDAIKSFKSRNDVLEAAKQLVSTIKYDINRELSGIRY